MAQPDRKRVERCIYARYDKNGKRTGYDVQFTDAAGKGHRATVHGNLNAARDVLAEARGRRVKQEPEPLNPKLTLAAVAAQYLEAHAGARRNTANSRASALARILPVLGKKRISAITRAEVRKFVAGEVAAGFAANTVRQRYATLRALFSFARDDLDIPVQFPRLKSSELPDPRDDQRPHRVLDDRELARLLAELDGLPRLLFQLSPRPEPGSAKHWRSCRRTSAPPS